MLIKNIYFLLLAIFGISIISCGEDRNPQPSGDTNLPPHKYEISLNSSLLAPIASPVGVTVDDSGIFWIMAGEHNGDSHTQISWDSATGSILSSNKFYGLIGELGTDVYGIAWDGSTIWISVSGNINKLVQVDPVTGDILRELSSPTVLGPSDLSWDGTNLWLSSGTGQIYTINPINGFCTEFINFEPERDSGIAIRSNGEVWFGNLFNTGVTIYNSTNTELIDTIDNAFYNQGERGLTFFNDQLIAISGAGIDLYDITEAISE